MSANGFNAEEQKAYLMRKGWVQNKKPHAWQWQLPPAPALHMLEHAFEVQQSLDNQKKTKAKGAVT